MAKGKGKHIDRRLAFIFYCKMLPNGRLPNYADVAKAFNCSKRAIEKIGTQEDWVRLRQECGKKELDAFFDAREEIIKETEKRDFDDWMKLEQAGMQALRIITDLQLELEKPDITLEEKLKVIKALQMQSLEIFNLSNALKNAKAFKRVILKLPTDYTKQDVDVKDKTPTLSPESIKEMDEFLEKNAKHTNSN